MIRVDPTVEPPMEQKEQELGPNEKERFVHYNPFTEIAEEDAESEIDLTTEDEEAAGSESLEGADVQAPPPAADPAAERISRKKVAGQESTDRARFMSSCVACECMHFPKTASGCGTGLPLIGGDDKGSSSRESTSSNDAEKEDFAGQGKEECERSQESKGRDGESERGKHFGSPNLSGD